MDSLKKLFSTASTGFNHSTQVKINKQNIPKSNPEFQILSQKKSVPFHVKEHNRHKTPQILKEFILSLIKDEFGQKFQFLYDSFMKWLQVEWKKIRMYVQSRLTKLSYLEDSLYFSPYKEIEKEILIEWRKNKLLNSLTFFWLYWFKNQLFRNRRQIQQYIDSFRNIFYKISMRLYQNCLNKAASNGVQIFLKLKRQTFTQLITQHKNWNEILQKLMSIHLKDQCQDRFSTFDFNSIQINPRIINIERAEDLFVKTKQSLLKLQKAFKLKDFTQILLEFRQNLLKEIQASIEIESLTNFHTKKHITVQKQDVINCVIWVLIKNKMTWIGNILNYYEMLLGKDIDKVLRWSNVDCFRIDIVAAHWFITNQAIQIPL